MTDPNIIYSKALTHPAIARALFAEEPAWIWSESGEHILWSNEAGCRFFDTKSMPDLLSRKFRHVSPATVQITRIAHHAAIGDVQEHELRFFQGMHPVTISATLERITLDNMPNAVFVRGLAGENSSIVHYSPKRAKRLIKLFGRAGAAAALLATSGKIKQASKAFSKAELEDAFLHTAARLVQDTPHARAPLVDNDRVLYLSAIPRETGAPFRIFAILGDAEISDAQKPDAQPPGAQTPNDAQMMHAPHENATDRDDPIPLDDEIVAIRADRIEETSATDTLMRAHDERPIRFLFALDVNQNIISLSPDIIDVFGPKNGNVIGQNWTHLSERFNLDPKGIIARKIERETIWSETVYWPLGSATPSGETGPLRAPTTMTAMPVFNSEREFEGFRGFGSIDMTKAAVHPELDRTIKTEAEVEAETEADLEADQHEPREQQWETLIATIASDDNAPLDDVEIDSAAIDDAHLSGNDFRRDEVFEPRDVSIEDTRAEHHDAAHGTHHTQDDGPALDEDELRWSEDFEDEAAHPNPGFARTDRNTAKTDRDNGKIVPLHRRPIGLPRPTVNDESSPLSKPEQHAFRQIAEALSARIEGDEGFSEISTLPAQETPAPADKARRQDLENPSNHSTIDMDAASFIEGHTKRPVHRLPDARASDRIQPVMPESKSADKIPQEQMPQSNPSEATPAQTFDNPDQRNRQTWPNKAAEISASETLAARDGILNRLPLGLIVSRRRDVLFANQSVLDFLGYDDLEAFEAAGGINTLFQADTEADPGSFVGRDILKHLVIKADHQEGHVPQAVRARLADGSTAAVDLRLQSGEWQGREALLMALSAKTDNTKVAIGDGDHISRLLGQSTDIMDIASDGILIIDESGQIIHANSSSEALFGRERAKMRQLNIVSLFAEESQKSIRDYLDGLTRNGVASVLNDGREAIGREAGGGLIPLFITIGRLDKNERFKDAVFCAVLRDITQWKRAEEELIESRRIAETANAQKSDFLAAISHEIRTPLNAIIGFSEVMMEQHFGPMENPRYLEYARDINISGNHLASLVNDLLDLSKIEAGKLDLTFSSVTLNPVIQECVALMQPDANRERIIIRTSLAENLPPVVADTRSIRQIALNLLSNAVKFTKAGGQVIISTTLEENGEVAIRVRDTGIGMSANDLEYAMQPFRQVQPSQSGRKPGTGLGLPLTKALVEANRARFTIDSRVDYGTLIQVIFPNERVLAR